MSNCALNNIYIFFNSHNSKSMAKKFTQLSLFGESKPNRVYKRDFLGRFASEEISNEERLFRENNRLKLDVEMWRRKAEALVKLIGHNKL